MQYFSINLRLKVSLISKFSAQRLRNAHVLVYAIGVSNLVNVQQLHQMTGNALRVFTVESFDQLDRSLADALTWEMCRTDFRMFPISL
jgi:hypothetical protein